MVASDDRCCERPVWSCRKSEDFLSTSEEYVCELRVPGGVVSDAISSAFDKNTCVRIVSPEHRVELSLGFQIGTLDLSCASIRMLDSSCGLSRNMYLEDVFLPSECQMLGDFTFGGCRLLRSVLCTDDKVGGINYVGENAFEGCVELRTVSLSTRDPVHLGKNSFKECRKFYRKRVRLCMTSSTLHLDGTIDEIELVPSFLDNKVSLGEELQFEHCSVRSIVSKEPLSEIYGLNENICSIPPLAPSCLLHYGCFRGAQLTTLVFPPGVVLKGEGQCRGMSSLTTVTLDSPVSIGDHMFYGCYVLSTVTITNAAPSSIHIGRSAFGSCNKLRNFSCAAESIAHVGLGAFQGCNALEQMVPLSPTCVLSAYSFTHCGFKVLILPHVKKIPHNCFSGCKSLEFVSCPVADEVGPRSFYECKSLASVDLPLIDTVFDSAFSYSGLVHLDVSELGHSQTTLKVKCFELMSCLRSVVTTRLVHEMFQHCTSLETVEYDPSHEMMLSNTVGCAGGVYIPRGCFLGCSSLKTFTVCCDVPELYVDYHAFNKCRSLSRVQGKDGEDLMRKLVWCKEKAFAASGVRSLDLVRLSCDTHCAFEECSSLSHVKLYQSTVGDRMFRDCSQLKTVDLYNTAKIGEHCFDSCPQLEKVSVYSSEQQVIVSTRAFQMSGLQHIFMAGPGQFVMQRRSLANCFRLQSVVVTGGGTVSFEEDALRTVRYHLMQHTIPLLELCGQFILQKDGTCGRTVGRIVCRSPPHVCQWPHPLSQLTSSDPLHLTYLRIMCGNIDVDLITTPRLFSHSRALQYSMFHHFVSFMCSVNRLVRSGVISCFPPELKDLVWNLAI